MHRFFLYHGLSVGLMIFSMAFGAGNLIYPLLTGYNSGNMAHFGFLGFFCASILLPLIGLFSVSFYEGDYRKMLSSYLPWFIAEIITFLSMLLLGPAGCIPRCVILAHSTLSKYLSMSLSAWIFGGIFLGLCHLIAQKKSNLIQILGKILAPITLGCLGIMIGLGLTKTPNIVETILSPLQATKDGFFNGCFTFDLLALVFYSKIIYQVVVGLFKEHNQGENSKKNIFKFLIFSGCIATMIFLFVYGGMTLCASLHSGSITGITSNQQLVPAFATLLLGKSLNVIYSAIVILACFSTSLSLLVVFSDYLTMLLRHRITYHQALLLSTISSFVLANLDFQQVSNLMTPMMFVIYPVLIPIIIFSVLGKLIGFKLT